MRIKLPSATLEDALSGLMVPVLRPMIKLLNLPNPQPRLKTDMIKAIRERLTGRSLRELWERLDKTQKLAVAETIHGFDTHFNADRFRAKYGVLPKGLDPESAKKVSLLRFFFYPPEGYRYFLPTTIPRDLEEQLREFVPEPEFPTVASLEEAPDFVDRRRNDFVPKGQKPKFDRVPLTRRNMELAAAYDLLAVLRLIDAGKISVSAKTRRASAVSVRRVAEVLYDGDFYDPTENRKRWTQYVGPIRSFAWPWLAQAGKLVQLRGSKLTLTKAGRAAFTAPPAETLRRIWKGWLTNTLLDEFSRVEAIKGQTRGRGKRTMTAPRKRRPWVDEALAECPVGRWVQVDEFFRFMQAAELDFSVTRYPWHLYLGGLEHGSFGLAGDQSWNALQGRYVLCLVFEYAATLGLVDVAFTDPRGARRDYLDLWGADDLEFLSRYDGLEYFRLNPLGAYCLGQADSYEPSTPPVRTALTLFTDLRVQSTAPLPPEERVLLEAYARAESDGVWRLDLSQAMAAVESGQDVSQLREFLTARDDQPLPDRVEGFLRRVEKGSRALTAKGPALLIDCADKAIADRIVADRRASKHCLRAGPRRLVVAARSEAAFRKAAHALGYAFSSV